MEKIEKEFEKSCINEFLKLEELRIGNWIMYRKAEYAEGPFKSLQVYSETFSDIENTCIVVKGIPITISVLEDFGFKWETTQKKHLCHDGDGYISFSFTAEQIEEGEVTCYCNNYFTSTWNVKLKYLHQLQNLFYSLTGKELVYKSK